MYVLTAPLDPADLSSLGQACARARLDLVTAPPDGPGELRDDLMAVFCLPDTAHPVDPDELRRRQIHTLLVRRSVSASDALAAVQNGHRFVLAAPLGLERVTKLLTYLREVAPPPLARRMQLDQSGTLSTPSGSVRLDPAETAALRLLGERPDGIVSRTELVSATGGFDPLLVTAQLRRRFDEIGSGAQILKVPHMGFRLVGEVRSGPGTAEPSPADQRP